MINGYEPTYDDPTEIFAYTSLQELATRVSHRNAGKITDRLIHLANVLFGWMPGGLAQVNIGASILFSGITGPEAATCWRFRGSCWWPAPTV